MNDIPCSPASVLGILTLFSLVKPLSAEHLRSFINTYFVFLPCLEFNSEISYRAPWFLFTFLPCLFVLHPHMYFPEKLWVTGSAEISRDPLVHVLPSSSATSRQPQGALVGHWTVWVKKSKAASIQGRKKDILVKTAWAEESSHSTLQGHFLCLTNL